MARALLVGLIAATLTYFIGMASAASHTMARAQIERSY